MQQYIQNFFETLESREARIARFLEGLDIQEEQVLVIDSGFEEPFIAVGPGKLEHWGELWLVNENGEFEDSTEAEAAGYPEATKIELSQYAFNELLKLFEPGGYDFYVVIRKVDGVTRAESTHY